MTANERAHLESNLGKSRARLIEEARLAFSPWASLVLVFTLAWALTAGLGRMLLDLDFGWHSRWAWLILATGVLLCTLIMVPHVARSMRRTIRSLVNLRSDLAGGVVEEEILHFTEAKRFQEPEHGGLVYFLRTTEDEVFVMFDHESQDLGVGGNDPLSSSFQPRTQLVLVRAPETRILLDRIFSGSPLPLPVPRELAAHPKDWPQSEEYCKTPWPQLEATFIK